jgi:glycosyl-4,4'-diaponeurosporenoate acyltransferase
VLINLPVFWIVTLNTAVWLAIQVGLAWGFLHLPMGLFSVTRLPRISQGHYWYERILRIKSWKDRLPDAAGWFSGGFAKAALAERNTDYLQRFVAETRRGEICHWMAIGFVPLFCLWNPGWAFWVNAAYALAANLPCILAQRYNRARLLRLLVKRTNLLMH